METSRHEAEPDSNVERAKNARELEQLGQELSEKLRSEMDPQFGRDLESARKFQDEDEKNRHAELDSEATDLQRQVDSLTENIASSTQQLAALPLTPEQQSLLERINQLIVLRDRTNDGDERAQLDDDIEATTRQLASLPVTDEQGALLDDILALMDQREKTEVQLGKIYASKRSK